MLPTKVLGGPQAQTLVAFWGHTLALTSAPPAPDNSLGILAVVISALSVCASLLTLLFAITTRRRQFNAQILLECSKRYDDIVANCPENVWWNRLDSTDLRPPSDAATLTVLRYLNLWCLEYYLWNKDFFSEEMWNVWGRMFAATLKSPLLLREWPKLRKDFEGYYEFTQLVDALQLPNGAWVDRLNSPWRRLIAVVVDSPERLNLRFDDFDSRLRALELSLFRDSNARIGKLEQEIESLKD